MAPLPWSRELETALIEKVRKEPALWNCRHELYKKKNYKKQLYALVAKDLQTRFPAATDITTENVQRKFAHLRTSFQRQHKIFKTQKNGSEVVTIPKWPLYNSLLFLIDTMETVPTFAIKEYGAEVDLSDSEASTSSEARVPSLTEDSDSSNKDTPSKAPVSRKKRPLPRNDDELQATHQTLNLMSKALTNLQEVRDIPVCCGIVAQRGAEKLPFSKQLKLLMKISNIVNEALNEVNIKEALV